MTMRSDRRRSDASNPTDIAGVLRDGALDTVFQPIVDLVTGEVVAHEALTRGPEGPLQMPSALFGEARKAGLLAELDRACLASAVRAGTAQLEPGATLFVNVEPEVIDFDSIGSLVDHGSSDAALRVVLEITERALVARPAELLAAVRQVRELGWAVALDDVGAESASLAFMPLVRPDVVKLDLGLVQGVRPLARPRSCTRSTRTPKRTGAWVLGEGIETTAHLTAAGRWVRPWCRDGCSDARQGPPSRPGPAGSACGRRAVRRPAPSRRRSTSCRRRAVCALAEGLTDTPLPGVRGTHLADDDPLRDEWDVTVLSPHFAAALLARDLGEDGPEMERMFEYALTYDRDTVVAATRCLISRVTGLRPRH